MWMGTPKEKDFHEPHKWKRQFTGKVAHISEKELGEAARKPGDVALS